MATRAHGPWDCARPADPTLEAGGRCQTSDSCEFLCTIEATLCPCGLSFITKETYECAACADEACEDDDIQCNNGLISRCTDGTWEAPEDCSDGMICDVQGDLQGCVDAVVFEEMEDVPIYEPKPPEHSGSVSISGTTNTEAGEAQSGGSGGPGVE